MNERGRASRSSLLMVAGLALLAAACYLTWTILWPDPYTLSDRVVRDARRALAAEVRMFERDAEQGIRDAARRNEDVGAAVDAAANRARQSLDEVIEDARNKLGGIDLELRTQRNRMERIEARAEEARDAIAGSAEEMKNKARAN